MIYTVTCNPALDCTVRLGALQEGCINRSRGCTLTPGGKGINVSRVLTALGEENTALGFVAGENGALLESALSNMGLRTDFIHLQAGQTRINVKLYGDTETELNAPGAPVPPEALAALEARLSPSSEDVVCLCGSLAPGMPADTYRRLVARLHSLGVTHTVVDTTGEALKAALSEKPWLVKPNREELAALVGRELPTLEAVVTAAGELLAAGARQVLVSLGGDGAVLCTAQGYCYQPSPAGQVVGTVGAGDSLVAGYVAGWLRTGDARAALRMGVACGSATAYAEGLATADAVEALLAVMPEME